MLLSYRGRSEKELRERLEKKRFSERHIFGVLTDLKQAGYLDDHALARDLKRQAFHNKLLGYARTKKFLHDRGVPDEVTDAVLEYDEKVEAQKILKLIDKKMKTLGDSLDKKKEKRLWDFLARKGYTFSTIRNALSNSERTEQKE